MLYSTWGVWKAAKAGMVRPSIRLLSTHHPIRVHASHHDLT